MAGLAALVFAVHDVPWALSQPFWNDENWVVVSTRFPLSDLPAHTSTTPIGFTVLLRAVVWGGDERFRLLPLLFSSGSVAAAYCLARLAGWRDRRQAIVAGLLAGGAALLVPSALYRNDLKPYTAEAFTALVVLALTANVERSWSRRSMGVLAAGIVAAKLVSHSVVFVAAAAFVSLGVVAAARRQWRCVGDTLAAGAAAAAGVLAIYIGFDRRADDASLSDFWADFFPPTDRGLDGVRDYLVSSWSELEGFLGLGEIWLAGGLVLTGAATLALAGRPALALAVILLPLELLVAGAAQVYPLLELRTSHFLLVTLAVVAAIGVAGLAALVGRVGFALSVVVAALAAALYLNGSSSELRAHTSIPASDVPSQVRFVSSNRRPGDVIVVNRNGSFGFGYYWRADEPRPTRNESVLQGWTVGYPPRSRIVVARSGRYPAIVAAVRKARTLADDQGGRVWIVRTFSLFEVWEPALASGVVAKFQVGAEPLLLVQPVAPVGTRLGRRDGRLTLVSFLGRDLEVTEGSVRGNVEVVSASGRRLVVRGWAADTERRRLADWVLVFAAGRLIAAGPPEADRPDIVNAWGSENVRFAGFELTSRVRETAHASRLRVFAVSGARASELTRSG